MKVVIYADGGSRGNPGNAGSGTAIYDGSGAKLLRTIAKNVGTATNNVAEYHGLLAGLQAAQELGATDVEVRMDSKLVVQQMSGAWKIKHPDMKELALSCQAIAATFPTISYTWIPREKNKKADELGNIAMDNGTEGFCQVIDATGKSVSDRVPDAEKIKPSSWNGATTTATRFLLLRHGQTTMSANRQYSGRSNPELTELGLWQAQRAAQRIASRGQLAAIVSSPLTRCQQTAQVVAKAMGMEVTTHEGLVELDFGQWDGLTFAEAYEADPQLHSRWLTDPQVAPPGGETQAQAYRRVKKARAEIAAEYAGATILVVSHVTPIKGIIREALGASADSANRMHLDLASFSIAEFYADGPTCVRLFNDTSHLK